MSWKVTAWGYPLWAEINCSSQSDSALVPAKVSLTFPTTTVVFVLPVISTSFFPIRIVFPTQFASESNIALDAVTFIELPYVAEGF